MKAKPEQSEVNFPIYTDNALTRRMKPHRAIMFNGWTQNGASGQVKQGEYTTVYGIGETDEQALEHAKKMVGPHHQEALNPHRVKYVELKPGEFYTIWGKGDTYLHHKTDSSVTNPRRARS